MGKDITQEWEDVSGVDGTDGFDSFLYYDISSPVSQKKITDTGIVVDYTLTPVNCEKKGYVWYKDSMYDPDAPKIVNAEFEELLRNGWKMGEPANTNSLTNNGIGIYKPKDK